MAKGKETGGDSLGLKIAEAVVGDARPEVKASTEVVVKVPPTVRQGTRQHELKCDAEYFQAVLDGSKTFELRENDRGFEVGDQVLLMETVGAGDSLSYTGRRIRAKIEYILHGPFRLTGLAAGWCIMTIKVVNRHAQFEDTGRGKYNVELSDGRIVTAWWTGSGWFRFQNHGDVTKMVRQVGDRVADWEPEG